MPSTLSWLDQTAEQQRRVREIVGLFAQPESRDELGIGQIRDVFSDRLFPGVSVIQTRARYALFVPWIFGVGASRRYSGPSLAAWVERQERRFIENLRDELVATGQSQDGLIGRVAGASVKILPSSIYWSGLHRWGILASWLSPDQLGLHDHDPEGVDELATRHVGDWHPTLPDPPNEFPDRPAGGFLLTVEEGEWLRERLMLATEGSLLAHLVATLRRPTPVSRKPWDDAACDGLVGGLNETLGHAQRFSAVMHGAALLYNLLVAELYVADGLTTVENPADNYRELLAEWGEEIENGIDLKAWDLDAFWALVMTDNPRVSPWTRNFVEDWIDCVGSGAAAGLADDDDARRLVEEREWRIKGRQSRLENPKLRQTWRGESGAGQLNYRWATVRTIVTDIVDGIEGHAVAAP